MLDDAQKFRDYLQAKTTVDDRALNLRVWHRFVDEITRLAKTPGGSSEFTLLDLGSGLGGGVRRMLERDVFLGFPAKMPIRWTLVDRSSAAVEHVRTTLGDSDPRYTLEAVQSDIVSFAGNETRRFHAIVAHAVLDMLDLDEALPAILSRLVPRGIGYFPICFDGVTIFEPPHELDDTILRSYHRSMGTTALGGPPRAHTGRTLLARLREENAQLLEVGSSDWIVYASEGDYPHRERLFLATILELVEGAVQKDPSVAKSSLSVWLECRRRQLDEASLVFIAHQLDYLIRRS